MRIYTYLKKSEKNYHETSNDSRYKYIEIYHANGIAGITQWMEVF